MIKENIEKSIVIKSSREAIMQFGKVEMLIGRKGTLIQNTEHEKNVLVIFILQETRNSNLFDKNCTWENVKCLIQHKENWLSIYISWKKLCSHTFKASSEEGIVMHSEKMKAKYMKQTCRLASRNFITD